MIDDLRVTFYFAPAWGNLFFRVNVDGKLTIKMLPGPKNYYEIDTREDFSESLPINRDRHALTLKK